MAILVTGANFSLGRAVTAALAADKAVHQDIRGIDQRFSAPMPDRVDCRAGDLRDRDFVAAAMEGIDCIVHCDVLAVAAKPSDGESEDNPGASASERLDRATRGTYVLTTEALKISRVRLILASSLSMFDSLPSRWKITEAWRPRPTSDLADMCPWLAELCVRECSRYSAIDALCLRFGRITADCDAAGVLRDAHSVHIDDAAAATCCAARLAALSPYEKNWRVFHIPAGGPGAHVRLTRHCFERLNYDPRFAAPGGYSASAIDADHSLREPSYSADARATAPSPAFTHRLGTSAIDRPTARAARRVVVLGAGGPVAAALAEEMAPSYRLRLTDVTPIADIARAGVRQSRGAPLPVVLSSPHECRTTDVRDPDQVMEACRDMDAVVNCTVLRHDPAQAFLVNTIGAYNVMRAAEAHGIRRVVQTGPDLVDLQENVSYNLDYDVPGDAPPRPGAQLYGLSKYLGQEICRVFAYQFGIEVPVLLFCHFFNPEFQGRGHLHPMSISWQDSARAIRRAVEVESLPSNYEIMNILTDSPHRVYTNDRARMLLGWHPRDQMDELFTAE